MARNSPAAERTQTRAEFPRASALSAPLSLAWSILCSGGWVGGAVSPRLRAGSVRSCVCRDENARDLMVCRGRGGTMSAPGSSSLSWRWRRLASSCTSSRAGPHARVTGRAAVWPTGPPGGPSIARVTMSIKHQTWPAAQMLPPSSSLLSGIKKKEAFRSTSPWGTFVRRFRDVLS